jgi:hypothetical protein
MKVTFGKQMLPLAFSRYRNVFKHYYKIVLHSGKEMEGDLRRPPMTSARGITLFFTEFTKKIVSDITKVMFEKKTLPLAFARYGNGF